jgi:predicted O-methyltransferase YrrM
MTEIWDAVDQYFTDLFLPSDPALEAAVQSGTAANLPAISVTPSQGKLLWMLARVRCARSILEIGTLGGYSTIWLARALPADGRLITLEIDPQYARVALANIDRAGLEHKVELRLGPAITTLSQFVKEGRGPFDFIFIDADKEGYPEYLRAALALSRQGTLIVADNVVRDGAIIDAESSDPSVRGVRRFNELLAAEPRVSTTVIPTVGSKGYDGFAIALVTADA